MRKRNLVAGISTISAGVLSIVLMFFTFLIRDTSTVATSRITKYSAFDIMNFNGVWSILAVSIVQIVLIIFARATIAIGVIKVIEGAKDKDYDIDEAVKSVLAILAFIGICSIFFAVLYCKFSNKLADTEVYSITYRVYIAPFMQVAICIAAFGISALMSYQNRKEEFMLLVDEEVSITASQGEGEEFSLTAEVLENEGSEESNAGEQSDEENGEEQPGEVEQQEEKEEK